MNRKDKDAIILVGAGGHCRSCIDIVESAGVYEITGIVGRSHELGDSVLGYKIEFSDEDLPRLVNEGYHFLITVGQIKSNQIRVRLFNQIVKLGGRLPVVVSPHAYVSRHSEIDDGTIVMHFAMINAGAKVGKNCILNSRALVEHDVVIGNHCHISTGTIINGGTSVGDDCFVGSGTVAKEGIQIGDNTLVGAAKWVDGRQHNKERS